MRRSKHNLSHFRNTSLNMGQLVPIGCAEVVQGDTFKHNTNMFMRLSPLVKPVMHPVHTHIHHYYVPYRLLWNEFEDFITGGEDFDDASVVPTIDTTGDPVVAGSLLNQLGVPVGFEGKVNAFAVRAYNFIYNRIYRDQQLQDEVPLSLDGGSDTTTDTDLLNANWSKDYFVSARPDDELGAEVSIPLGDTAPIVADGDLQLSGSNFTNQSLKTNGGGDIQIGAGGTSASNIQYAGGLAANFSGDGISLDDLRLAIATQKMQEYINIRGNFYPDYLKRHGVKYSDGRLNEPEYLAGGKQTVQFSEVISTAEGTNTAVGDLAGHGIAAMRSNSYMKFFEEPGLVISLLHVKPVPMYAQALHKMWSRRTREEFYQKEFEVLGMQEIKNKEIKHDHATPDGTFGFGPRFDEFRRIPNTVHGEFADPANVEMNSFHMARRFSNDPALNSSFITCVPPDRIFADTNQAQLQCTVQHKIAARRIVSKKAQTGNLTI
jgi:hypothetical protein